MAEYIKKAEVLDLIHLLQSRSYWLDNSKKYLNGVVFRAFLERFEEEINLMETVRIGGDWE